MKDQRSKIKDQNKSKGKSSEIQTNLIIKGSRILIFGLGSWSLFCALILGLWISCPSLAYAQSTIYPKFDISGYKRWEYKRVDVDPSSNYFSGLTQLGGFYQTYSGGPWQERLKLKIIGELSKDLSVTYNINQQPETPDQFDVQVKYKDTELTFGDFSATFSGNEFASVSKTLNGVKLTSKNSWHDVLVVPSTKLKSQTQALTAQKGNNTKGPYSLGRGSIVEDSEKVELNNVPLKRNVDYTINYFEGKITFNKILTTLDEFKYSYEYTNMLDLFFPSLSKRDFFGFQSRFTIDPKEVGKPPLKKQLVVLSNQQLPPRRFQRKNNFSWCGAAKKYSLYCSLRDRRNKAFNQYLANRSRPPDCSVQIL